MPPPDASQNSMVLDGKAAHFGTMYMTVCAPRHCDLPEPRENCEGWQHHGCSSDFRETELLPTLQPPAQTMLRSLRAACVGHRWQSKCLQHKRHLESLCIRKQRIDARVCFAHIHTHYIQDL